MSVQYAFGVMVTGSRELKDTKSVTSQLDEWYAKRQVDILIVGDCPTGADHVAREWAAANKKPIRVFEAEWKKFGRAAGPMRNIGMVKWATMCCKEVQVLAFPLERNAKSGTRHCMNTATKSGLSVLAFAQKQ